MNNLSTQRSPFHRFQGYKLLALVIVTALYSYWFSVHGPFSKLAALAPGMPLEEAMYYSGSHAVQVLSQLDSAGQKAKYISLAFDVPFMILSALAFEGLIAFGQRRMALRNVKWNFLFVFPLGFLIFDFLEDSALALTLASGSEAIGTFAGLMTPTKMVFFMAAMLLAFGFGIAGLIVWLSRKGKPKDYS